jgi:hypothetical protein
VPLAQLVLVRDRIGAVAKSQAAHGPGFFAAISGWTLEGVKGRTRFSLTQLLPLTRPLRRGTLPARRFPVHLSQLAALQQGFAVRLFADLIEDATRWRVVAIEYCAAEAGDSNAIPFANKIVSSTTCRMRRPSRATSVLLHTLSFAGRGTSLRKLTVVCTRKFEILPVPGQTQSSSGSVGGLRSFRNCSALTAAGIV